MLNCCITVKIVDGREWRNFHFGVNSSFKSPLLHRFCWCSSKIPHREGPLSYCSGGAEQPEPTDGLNCLRWHWGHHASVSISECVLRLWWINTKHLFQRQSFIVAVMGVKMRQNWQESGHMQVPCLFLSVLPLYLSPVCSLAGWHWLTSQMELLQTSVLW